MSRINTTIKDIQKSLKCTLCCKDFKPPYPVFLCNGGHSICANCNKPYSYPWKPVLCPICNKWSTKRRNRALEKIVNTGILQLDVCDKNEKNQIKENEASGATKIEYENNENAFLLLENVDVFRMLNSMINHCCQIQNNLADLNASLVVKKTKETFAKNYQAMCDELEKHKKENERCSIKCKNLERTIEKMAEGRHKNQKIIKNLKEKSEYNEKRCQGLEEDLIMGPKSRPFIKYHNSTLATKMLKLETKRLNIVKKIKKRASKMSTYDMWLDSHYD